MTDLKARLDEVIADPPVVHPRAPRGVWSTQRSCYEHLLEHLAPGMRTLETGAGVSTVVFALAGAHHTSVHATGAEGDRVLEYCRSRSIPSDRLSLVHGSSDHVLPRLPQDELDLVFIDGNHGYPFPQLDWYYAGGRLREGGLLFVDDVQLPAVDQIVTFLEADPRWETDHKTEKWVAFRRLTAGSLRESHSSQRFLPRRKATRGPAVRLEDRARRVLRPVRRRLRALREASGPVAG